jgi:hypothetical protein
MSINEGVFVIAAMSCVVSACYESTDLVVAPDRDVCWTMSAGLTQIDMASGSAETVEDYATGVYEPDAVTAISVDYYRVLVLESGRWFETDLSAETFAAHLGSTDAGFAGISAYRGQLVTFCPEAHFQELCFYEDLGQGGESARIEVDATAVSRFTVHGDEGYFAWHSTDTVEVVSMIDGRLLRTIELEGFDTWVWGMSVAGGRLYLLDDGRGDAGPGTRITSFDAVTGENLGDVVIGDRATMANGLWCHVPEER